ncbi:hypothetical protein VKT23_015537 [Stygiomarasmius scandens]|uniref:FAD-binding domain-containing protein n=1 Tax=Marasmiellus scandens TaxID=2682957 RepID=A0ABR1J1R5_9AGAR
MSLNSRLFSSSAACKLDFVVIGGSVGGLTAAYCLQEAGHNVVVLEKNKQDVFMMQNENGLRVPPNMTKLLNKIPGIKHLLVQKGTSNPGYHLYQDETFELVGKMIYEESITSDLGKFAFRLPYSYLWNHLYQICKSRNVSFKFNSEVEKVDLNGGRAKVLCKTGESIEGDILIGADGHNSIVRNFLLLENAQMFKEDEDEDEDDHECSDVNQPEIWTTRRLSIPMGKMKTNPDLQILTQNNWTTLLMGNGYFAMGGQEGAGRYGVSITYLQPPKENYDLDWTTTKNVLSFEDKRLINDDTVLGKLIELPDSCHGSTQKAHNLSAYINSTHQIVVIGDAAPATLMNGAYNAAIAVEDAFSLGYLFSKIASRNHVSLFLNGYSEIRKTRAKFMRANDMGVLYGLSLPPGPQRDARNYAYSHTLGEDDLDDETLSQVWAAHIDQCNYNAIEAVDEWWHSWGSLIEKYHG